MRIKDIRIKSFRGIPNDLKLSFPFKNKQYCSLIILGDNGTGKSSIVDALEFCLQGQIHQDTDLGENYKPSVISLSNPKIMPDINVTFESDETFKREIAIDEDGYLTNHKKPSKYFSISPFVLRRNDILKFIDTPDAEKTLVFSNYFRNENFDNWIDTPKGELKKLQNLRLLSKDKRDKFLKELAEILNICIGDIPIDEKRFRQFVKENINYGLSDSDIKKSCYKIKLNTKAKEVSESALAEIQNTKNIKKLIREYSVNDRIESFPKHLLPQLDNFLKGVGRKITSSFLYISPLDFVDSISVIYEKKNILALKIILRLKNGRECSPQQILSEANLDLLALLFYISFIEESSERGQSKFLVLDDVLQSIDSTIRVNFINYLVKNFNDWQFLFTVHDRLWYRQLKDLLNLYSHPFSTVEINKWSFLDGPRMNFNDADISDCLLHSIEKGHLISICSHAGLLIEEICYFLSVNLSTTIHRKKDDRYTIADLWPGISKLFKKTLIRDKVLEVDKWLHLRNIIGAHYNDWANNLSMEESMNFGYSVLNFFKSIRCDSCKSYVMSSPNFNFYVCRCGNLLVKK